MIKFLHILETTPLAIIYGLLVLKICECSQADLNSEFTYYKEMEI